MLSTLLCTLITGTGLTLDLRVDGLGLMRFARDGRAVYAKSAHLVVQDGHLMEASGVDLLPSITVPASVTCLEVDLQGRIYAVTPQGRSKVGELVLAGFTNEGVLTPDGPFLIARDRPSLGDPGQDLFGVVRSGSASGDRPDPVRTAVPPLTPVTAPTKFTALPPLPRLTSADVEERVDRIKSAPSPLAGYVARAPQRIKGEPPVLTLKTDGEAKGDQILLGDVADIQGTPAQVEVLQGIPVGDTPVVGVNRGMDGPTLTAALNRAGWKAGTYVLNVVPNSHVHRQGQQIDEDAFVTEALNGLQTQTQIQAKFHEAVSQSGMTCPLGVVSLRTESCAKANLGYSVLVGVYVDGKRFNGRQILLTPDADAACVRSGQNVRLILKSGGAIVEYAAKAKETGWLGQTILVEAETGALLKGTVSDNGIVVVEL